MYDDQVRAVNEALEMLKLEAPALAAAVHCKGEAASTGLEYYGIVKAALEHAVDTPELSFEAKVKIREAIGAVVAMYQS